MKNLTWGAALLAGAAGASAGLAWLLLGSRALLGEGGLCSTAVGAARSCPAGLTTTLWMVGLGVVLCLALHLWAARRMEAPSVAGLLWCGLTIGSAWSVYEVGVVAGMGRAPTSYLLVASALLMLGALPLIALITGALLSIFGPSDHDIFQRPDPPVARRALAEVPPGEHRFIPATAEGGEAS